MEQIKQFMIIYLNLKTKNKFVITTSAVIIGSIFIWQLTGKYYGLKYTPQKIIKMAIPDPPKKLRKYFREISNSMS